MLRHPRVLLGIGPETHFRHLAERVAGIRSMLVVFGMQFTRLVSPTGFYIIDALQLGDMSVLADVLRHAVLPALALGLLTAGVFIRLVRTM